MECMEWSGRKDEKNILWPAMVYEFGERVMSRFMEHKCTH